VVGAADHFPGPFDDDLSVLHDTRRLMKRYGIVL